MQCAWIAIVLFTCIGFTQALRCYTCLPTDSNCNDPFDKGQRESLLQSCPAGADTACLKSKIIASGVVIRSCTNNLACTLVGGNNVCAEVGGEMACCCTSDGCNGATTRHIGYIALVAMLVFGKVVVALF